MKKIATFFMAMIVMATLTRPLPAQAAMPAKARAVLTIIGYGTAGGALLGTASLAFGTSTRAVAQGASIGLYAGILFGAYVIFSAGRNKQGTYDDSNYDQATDVYGEDYDAQEGGGEEGRDPQGSFNRFSILQEGLHGQAFTGDSQKVRGSSLPPLTVNIINFNF